MRINNIVAFKFNKLSHDELLGMAMAVASTASGNANFTSPVNPTLIQLGTFITAFSDAITAWGPEGNRGSHAQYVVLIDARKTLEEGLNGLALYAENVAAGSRSMLATIDWPLRKINEPNGPLGAVINLRQLTKNVLQGTIKIKWNKPADSSNKKVKNYRVMRSSTNNFADAVEIALIGKTTFIDENPGTGVNWYWIIPVNAAGDGVTSLVLPAVAQMA